MSLPSSIATMLRENGPTVLAALTALSIAFVILFFVTLSRLNRLTRLYSRLTRGTSGLNLEEIFSQYADDVHSVAFRLEAIEKRIASLEDRQQRCLQHVGLIRYDAFEDVGGEQSFSAAVIDDQKTGVILSSVYSRSDVRVYAKSLDHGKASHTLTSEEQKAVNRASEG